MNGNSTSYLLITLAVLLVYGLFAFNRLIQLRNRVRNSWAQVDVELRRRHDLIPRLLTAVQAYMAHEQDLLTDLAQARAQAVAAGQNPEALAGPEGRVSSAARQLLAVAEAYPNLQADTVFADLHNELRKTERRLTFARQFYNDTTYIYNTRIEVFPDNILAGLFGFQRESFFQMDDAAGGTGEGVEQR